MHVYYAYVQGTERGMRTSHVFFLLSLLSFLLFMFLGGCSLVRVFSFSFCSGSMNDGRRRSVLSDLGCMCVFHSGKKTQKYIYINKYKYAHNPFVKNK